jgi:hypothetical protein
MLEQSTKIGRLETVTQRIGYALWQLQELEGCSATCFVLLVQASRGMGMAAGEALLKTAHGKTFGATVKQLEKAGLLSEDLAADFARLLEERNWLVHRSRSDSRGAILSDDAALKLLGRLDAIADDATTLLKKIGLLIEGFVLDHGVSKDHIDMECRRILAQWETGDDV